MKYILLSVAFLWVGFVLGTLLERHHQYRAIVLTQDSTWHALVQIPNEMRVEVNTKQIGYSEYHDKVNKYRVITLFPSCDPFVERKTEPVYPHFSLYVDESKKYHIDTINNMGGKAYMDVKRISKRMNKWRNFYRVDSTVKMDTTIKEITTSGDTVIKRIVIHTKERVHDWFHNYRETWAIWRFYYLHDNLVRKEFINEFFEK